jgi:ABC-type dipeptide/oligopeptide/nickel transport system permease component
MRIARTVIGLLGYELVGKTVVIALATTALTHALLTLTPAAHRQIAPVRYSQATPPVSPAQPRHGAVSDTARNVPSSASQPPSSIVDPSRVGPPLEPVRSVRSPGGGGRDATRTYLEWLAGVLRWDFGRSELGASSVEEVGVRLLVTARLAVCSFLPALVVSIFLGVLRPTSGARWVRHVACALTSLPSFLLGYFLFGAFAPSLWLGAATLALSSGIVNELSRVVDDAMAGELRKEYMETALAKGLPDRILPLPGSVRFHALRNALIPLGPRVCLLFGFAVSASMVAEQVFRLPGVSYMLIDGLVDRDVNRVLIVILFCVILTRVASILGLVVYSILQPRRP